MIRQTWLAIGLAVLASCVTSRAEAYTRCTQAATTVSGTWPTADNPSLFGTQKWEFEWVIEQQGLEIRNVRYTSDLSQPKKLVMSRGGLPFLPAAYPDQVSGAACTAGEGFTYPDRVILSYLDTGHPYCCAHVPTTVCSADDRDPSTCAYYSGTLSSCPGGTSSCNGACAGTQVDTAAPLEDGIGEVVSGASDADLVLTATFAVGAYQFVQRWRFSDDGTIRPTIRLGGVHDCMQHTHQVYWRFNFDLAESSAASEVIQQCPGGGCGDLSSGDWSPNLGCGCGVMPAADTWWRVQDNGVAGRAVVLESGSQGGVASTFCDQAVDSCGSCSNVHDFCALAAADPWETLMINACNDNLGAAASAPECGALPTGTDSAFWYFSHVDNHIPCQHLETCSPELGAVALGPVIRLVGSW